MQATKLLTAGDAQRRLGIHKRDLYRSQHHGALAASNTRPGPGGRRSLTPKEALAARVYLDARAKGFTCEQRGRIAAWVLGLSWHVIQTSVEQGCSLILVIGDSICPRLLNHSLIFDNPYLPVAEMAKAPAPVGIIDIAPTVEKIVQFLSTMDNDCTDNEPETKLTGTRSSQETPAA